MAGNGSFVTKDGRVIHAQVEETEPQQPPPDAEVNVHQYVERHNHPIRGILRTVLRGMDMPRAAAFMVLVIVCILAVMLVYAGIRNSGKWLFSGRKAMSVMSSESHRVNPPTVNTHPVKSYPVNPQKPVTVQTRSYPKTHDRVADGKSHKHTQPGDEVRTYDRDDRKQDVPVVSKEPAVDYWSSIKEMETVLDAEAKEMNRITNKLRSMRGSD